MASEQGPNQVVETGSRFVAQADRGSTSSVTVYEWTPPKLIDDETLAVAYERLAQLPLDRIPEPAPLPTGSRVIFGHNPVFVGRQYDLCALARVLKGGETAAIGQVAAATGLGGIGKTQLASEFAHRYGQYFAGGVFWLSFAGPEAIPAEVASCGQGMSLHPEFSSLPLDEQIRLVLSAWQSALPRLLLFDNCEDIQLLVQWRPPTGASRVLLTSRRGEWDPVLGVQSRKLDVLNRTESVTLLMRYRPNVPAGDFSLHAIAKELGDHPLALHLAASYLMKYRYRLTPAAYLEELVNKKLLQHDSLQRAGLSPTGHELSVGRTFALSYDQLDLGEPVDTLALALLARATYFAPGEPILRELLCQTLEVTGDEQKASLQMEDALQLLVDLGLLETDSEGAPRLHLLIRAFVQEVSRDGKAQGAVEESLISEAHRLNMAGYPHRLLPLQVHIRGIIDSSSDRVDDKLATLCANLGRSFAALGAFTEAQPLFERALAINEQVLGPEHSNTASSLNNLASVLQRQGKYTEAQPLFERALAINEQVLGPEHSNTAGSLNNLASVLQRQGKYAEAQRLFERLSAAK